MALEDVGPVLAKEYVTVKIDYDRAKGARDMVKRYAGKEQGLPWFMFLDADGRAIATSIGAKGNVGMPWQPDEVAHFKTMLEAAKKHLSTAQIDALIASIQDFRKRAEAK